ncbi:hypothetical protein [Streptomyces sp. NPDC002588]|uniref:hypothetical protein n=1 Tax=Streptomyces sp. NPDC002588 TaxID=3154419 RepID=UPI00331B875D
MAALAVRLRERVAEVRVCAPPDEEFGEPAAIVGLDPVPAGRSVRVLFGAAHDGPVPAFEALPATLETAPAPETRARAAVAATVRAGGATVAARLPLDTVGEDTAGNPHPER